MKLLNPRDAQAWNGAGICHRQLGNKTGAAHNYNYLGKADFPATALEWYILAEIQELGGFAYKEDVLKSYRQATILEPKNSIYNAKLFTKIGQHSYQHQWQRHQRKLSEASKNARLLLRRIQKSKSGQPQITMDYSKSSLSTNVDSNVGRNGAMVDAQRLEDMRRQFAELRAVSKSHSHIYFV